MRSSRSDASTTAVAALQSAATGVPVPSHVSLRPGDMPFWSAITRSRMAHDWAPSDLLHVANLARTSADIERVSRELAERGDVVNNAKGTPVSNPLHSVLETLTGRSLALTRVLQLHAVPHGKTLSERGAAKAAAMQANDALDAAEASEGLLAVPVKH